MHNQNLNAEPANCYVALELSRSRWLVGALLPGSARVTTISVAGGDTDKLLVVLNGIVAKAAEAGQLDAFEAMERISSAKGACASHRDIASQNDRRSLRDGPVAELPLNAAHDRRFECQRGLANSG